MEIKKKRGYKFILCKKNALNIVIITSKNEQIGGYFSIRLLEDSKKIETLIDILKTSLKNI